MSSIILASGSKYRAELLRKLHIDFDICPSYVDETPQADESAMQLALRLSKAKALAISEHFPQHLIIGSDQTAVCEQQLLNKPGTRSLAIQQLQAQSGKTVRFYTGICVLDTVTQTCLTELDTCTVHFKYLSRSQIEHYVDLDQPLDCAGSFKAESLGIALFSSLETEDPNALIGLPLIKLIKMLSEFGVEIL
jgi:MAF protein